MRYSLGIAYLLWFISGFGALGLHRFYLGKVGTGFLWLVTGGLGMAGGLYDALTMGRQVEDANLRDAARRGIAYAGPAQMPAYGPVYGPAPRPEKPEKTVLRVARQNKGFVTPGEVALEGELSVDEARSLLEKLAASGHAEMRVRASGVVVYYFPEFAEDGNEDFAL